MSVTLPAAHAALTRCARLALLLPLPLTGCEQPPSHLHQLDVLVEAHSDDGEPLSGVELSREGRALGRTDAQGRLTLRLEGTRAERLGLDARCPEGFHSDQQRLEVLLDDLVSLQAASVEAPAQAPRRLSLSCRPALRGLAVVVRSAGHAGLPVLVDGRRLAVTDEGGLAHALLEAAPEATLRVVLDTSAQPELRPHSPERSFLVPDRDEVLVFDQPLTAPPPRAVARRRAGHPLLARKRGAAAPALRHVPVRIR